MTNDRQITDFSAFRLSRIFAEGRKRAHELSRTDRAQVELCGSDVLNPYAADPERTRWGDGFFLAYMS